MWSLRSGASSLTTALVDAGHSLAAVAETFGVSRNVVGFRLVRELSDTAGVQ